MNALDQIFVTIKHSLVGFTPVSLQWLVSILLSVAPIMGVFAGCFALTTIVERKALGRIQNRYGPNRVGPWGLFQPIADGIKMLTKEDIVPASADKLVHFLAPLVLTVPVWLAFAVLPFGRNMAAVELDAGILFFFAAGSASELAVFMAGWASQNKYSLVGAMRAIPQMISYEVPLVLSTVPILMLTGSLSLSAIVEAQSGYMSFFVLPRWFILTHFDVLHRFTFLLFGVLPRWFILTPCGFAGFFLFLIAATAESNRAPFDLPEAESEIIAGYLTEYSGFKYALFFLGEYLGLFVVTGLAVTLFLGGWHAPFPFLEWVPSWFWFFAKFSALILVFIWVRGTVPRLRLDQLLGLAWKFLVPLSLINLVVAATWHLSRTWQFPAALEIRWLLCAAMIAVPYVLLGRALSAGLSPNRLYRYAE